MRHPVDDLVQKRVILNPRPPKKVFKKKVLHSLADLWYFEKLRRQKRKLTNKWEVGCGVGVHPLSHPTGEAWRTTPTSPPYQNKCGKRPQKKYVIYLQVQVIFRSISVHESLKNFNTSPTNRQFNFFLEHFRHFSSVHQDLGFQGHTNGTNPVEKHYVFTTTRRRSGTCPEMVH
jgi:hypothetical protein